MASNHSAPKRPRLSLQIQTSSLPQTKTPRNLPVDPKDPTAFNTVTNAYVSAIERSTSMQSEPITAINTLQAFSIATPSEYKDPKLRVTTPYVATYPETPLSATPSSSPQVHEMHFPSAMAATPPLSAGSQDHNEPRAFSFAATDAAGHVGRAALLAPGHLSWQLLDPPYPHPQTPLHSILRNSPLPPKTAIPPPSPRRQSLRLQEKAARKVAYNSPLTQEITTQKYTKSHVDLLLEEASPNSPSAATESGLNLAAVFTANELQDGGQTPGPFGDMSRRMTAAFTSSGAPASPASPAGIRKRKKKEKRRRWVWTIGQDDEDDQEVGGAIAALRAEAAKDKRKAPRDTITQLETPTPSIEESDSSIHESLDVEMSDVSSLASEAVSLDQGDSETDPRTPRASGQQSIPLPPPPPPVPALPQRQRDTPIPELSSRGSSLSPEQRRPKRDTPIPPEGL